MKIPLRRRDGSVVAETIIDACDFEWLMQWRWHLHNGYAKRSVRQNGKRVNIKMHRAIAQRHGLDMSNTIDHANRDKLDNRLTNLRPASYREQMLNRGKMHNNTSNCIGVIWDKQTRKWRAQITINRKHINLGRFDNLVDASSAYNLALIETADDWEFIQLNRVNLREATS